MIHQDHRLSRNTWRLAGFVLLGSLLFLPGCQQQTGEEAPPGERVENPNVGIAIAALPSFFAVESNEGEQIALVPADGTTPGRLLVQAGPAESGGINLVAAVQAHADSIRDDFGGQYKGQNELGSHLGTAFYSRGQYDDDGGQTTEETVIFLVHPWGDRTLQLIYRYPPGEDSKARLEDQLFEVLGELEPLDQSPAPEASSEESTEG